MVKVEIARRRCMQMSVQATGAGRAGASCVLAAVGRRSAEAGADCGTISSAGLGLLVCLLLLLLTARLVDRVHFNNGPPLNVVMIDQRSNKRSSAPCSVFLTNL